MNNRNTNIRGMQQINRARVLNTIRGNKHIPRITVSESTGLSAATVTNIVGYLIRIGLVREVGQECSGKVGRRSIQLDFDGERYRMIAVHFNQDRLNICLIDLLGNVHDEIQQSISIEGYGKIRNMINDGIRHMLELPEGKLVIAIGIALSALVLDHGRFVVSSQLNMDGEDLRSELERITDIPILIENITFVRAQWLCREYGSPTGYTMYVDLDHGIGAALTRDGERVKGVPGEIGHMPMEGGERLETLCAPERILEGSMDDLARFRKRLMEKDPKAIGAAERCAGYLGRAIAGMANMFDPSVILVNNSDYGDCPEIVEKACDIMRSGVLHGIGRNMKFVVTRFRGEELNQAISYELSSMIFSPSGDRDMFELLERMGI